MGKTKIKIIDDSQPTAEVKSQNSKFKTSDKNITAKSEPVKASGEVETIARGDAEESASWRIARNDSEDGRRVSSAAGPRADESKPKVKISKRAQKKTVNKPRVRGKKYQEAVAKINRSQKYHLNEAIKLAQEVSYSKFTGTIEAHINTSAKSLRGLVTLPYMAGKKLTILAFGKDADKSGSDTVGSDETISEIEKGKIHFDVVITTPEWMPKLARVAKILGPRGLMPNPKNGTITDNLTKAVSELQAGKTEYKTEGQAPVIHLAVGKAGQPEPEISANIKALYNTVGKSRIKKITLSPTMGPGIKVDLGSI